MKTDDELFVRGPIELATYAPASVAAAITWMADNLIPAERIAIATGKDPHNPAVSVTNTARVAHIKKAWLSDPASPLLAGGADPDVVAQQIMTGVAARAAEDYAARNA